MKRRVNPRFPFSISVDILDKKEKKTLHGKAENVSKKGFLFIPDNQSKLHINEFLYPKMSVKIKKGIKETLGEIQWCEKDLKDSTHLGIRLEAPIKNIGVPLPVGELNDKSLDLSGFSENIENKVKFTQDKSLYKYLSELLHLADQFICSDIGYIGYVISHPDQNHNDKIIAISHTVHVGGKEKENLKEKYQKHESVNAYDSLVYFNTKPWRRKKRTCMAHCFQSKKPYLLRHKDNKHMKPEEINAKRLEYFAHFNKRITAELTVPIVVDDEVKIILNFETTLKNAPNFNGVTRELLWIFAEKVASTFKKAMFEKDETFLSLFYHAATHQIMGQYNNAANEFNTWRRVQCQEIFNKYPFTEKLFSRLRGFYKYLVAEFRYKEHGSENTFPEFEITNLFREPDRSKEERNEDRDNKLEYGFPLFALLNTYHQVVQKGGSISWEARWRDRIENIYHLIIEKKNHKQNNMLMELPEPEVTKLPDGKKLKNFKDIYDSLFAEKRDEFKEWRNESCRGMKEENFFNYYLNLSFLIGITKITKIQEVLKKENNFTFEEFKAVKEDDIFRLKDIIICCSTLILWEDIRLSKEKEKEKNQKKEKKHDQMSVPSILAYLYRGEAYLMLDEKRKAYNDFSLLERLVETCDVENPNWLPNITGQKIKQRGEDFKHWLKILLKHQKGKVYFAAFAHQKALATFCGMMEKYNEFKNKPFKKEIAFQYTMVEAMRYKGKLFLDIGSFQRSLKWFLKGIMELLPVEYESGSLKGYSLYRIAERLLWRLIDKLEEFKHNATIIKGELIDSLWISQDDILKVSEEVMISDGQYKKEHIKKFIAIKSKKSDGVPKILLTNFLFGNFKKPTKSCNAKLLSDFCNRVGFVLFLINLYPTKYSSSHCEEINKKIQLDNELDEKGKYKYIDLASEWIDWAIKFNPHNGFAMFNRWLIDFDRDKFQWYSGGKIKKEFPITLKQERFYRSFYPILLHTIHKKFPVKEPNEPFSLIAYRLSRYLLTYIDDLIKKPAEVYSYLTREGLLEEKEPLDGLYSLERWSSWAHKLPRPRMFSCRGGGKLLVWKGKGIAIDPGFDFLTNLYGECFSLKDIDAICITHDHIDHTDDFDAICRLIKEYRKVVGDKKQLVLLVNPGFSQKCSHYLKDAEDQGEIKHVYLLNHDTTIDLVDYCLSIKILRAVHKEQSTQTYAVGLIFQLKDKPDDKPVIEIGFTSDTRYTEDSQFTRDFEKLASCDMVVANLSHATLRELKGILELEFKDTLYKNFWLQLFKESDDDTKRILKWALWYGERNNISAIGIKETLRQQQEGKGILAAHLGISGINKVWEQMKENSSDRIKGCKLMIISEFREELGSFRSKIAQLLNRCSASEHAMCYTSDIGMAIRFEKNSSGVKYQIKLQCSFCKQDNGLNIGNTPFHPYTFHLPKPGKENMNEVCVKGDNEGIFYFCENHITGPKGQFLEGIDRYSPLTLE